MSRLLKTNTAVRITVGPFLDVTDGKTPENALDVTAITCELYYDKDDGNGATRAALTLTASEGSNDMIHITNDTCGMYDLELTTTNTNFLGRAILTFHDDDVHLPVWHEFMVVHADFFNVACSTKLGAPAGASLAADIAAVKGETADILTDTGTTLPGTLSTMDGKLDTIDGIVDDILVDTETTIPGTISTMQGNVTDILTDTGTTLPGTLSTMDGKVDTIDGIVDDILIDTGTTLDGALAVVDGNVDSILEDTGTTIPGTVSTMQGNVTDILTDTGTTLPGTLSTIDGKIDTIDGIADDILVDTGTDIPGAISGLNDIAAADVMDVASALTLDFGTLLERLYQMVNNKMTVNESSGAVALRNIGDTGSVATGSVTSSSGTTTRDELAWA